MYRHHDEANEDMISAVDGEQAIYLEDAGDNLLLAYRDKVAGRLERLSRNRNSGMVYHRPTALDELEEHELLDIYLDAVLMGAEEEFIALIEEILVIRSHPYTRAGSSLQGLEERIALRLNDAYME